MIQDLRYRNFFKCHDFDKLLQNYANLDFLGKRLPKETAVAIAKGEIDPMSHQNYQSLFTYKIRGKNVFIKKSKGISEKNISILENQGDFNNSLAEGKSKGTLHNFFQKSSNVIPQADAEEIKVANQDDQNSQNLSNQIKAQHSQNGYSQQSQSFNFKKKKNTNQSSSNQNSDENEPTPIKQQIAGSINKKRKYDEYQRTNQVKVNDNVQNGYDISEPSTELQIHKYFRKNDDQVSNSPISIQNFLIFFNTKYTQEPDRTHPIFNQQFKQPQNQQPSGKEFTNPNPFAQNLLSVSSKNFESFKFKPPGKKLDSLKSSENNTDQSTSRPVTPLQQFQNEPTELKYKPKTYIKDSDGFTTLNQDQPHIVSSTVIMEKLQSKAQEITQKTAEMQEVCTSSINQFKNFVKNRLDNNNSKIQSQKPSSNVNLALHRSSSIHGTSNYQKKYNKVSQQVQDVQQSEMGQKDQESQQDLEQFEEEKQSKNCTKLENSIDDPAQKPLESTQASKQKEIQNKKSKAERTFEIVDFFDSFKCPLKVGQTRGPGANLSNRNKQNDI